MATLALNIGMTILTHKNVCVCVMTLFERINRIIIGAHIYYHYCSTGVAHSDAIQIQMETSLASEIESIILGMNELSWASVPT